MRLSLFVPCYLVILHCSSYLIISPQNSLYNTNNIAYYFTNIYNESDIFPFHLQFDIKIAQQGGLLFYYIDKYKNQLIVTFNSIDSSLQIKFRDINVLEPLNKLCKCQAPSCLNEMLRFRFQVKQNLEIQCNDTPSTKYNFTNKKIYNYDYPIPDFRNEKLSAKIYFKNHPEFYINGNRINPNPEYFTGCISNIEYNGKPLDVSICSENDVCKDFRDDESCYQSFFKSFVENNSNGTFFNDTKSTKVSLQSKSNILIINIYLPTFIILCIALIIGVIHWCLKRKYRTHNTIPQNENV